MGKIIKFIRHAKPFCYKKLSYAIIIAKTSFLRIFTV